MGRTSLLNVMSAVALAGMASAPRRITVRRTILINTSRKRRGLSHTITRLEQMMLLRWLRRSRGQRVARVRAGHAAMRGVAMRACMLFFTGLLVGVGLHTVTAQGPNNTPNKGLVQVNHIGMNVPNLDEAVAFYTKTMGFPEAFRVNDEKGQARLVYVQISKNTFFEIQPGPGRPAAINHVGIHVENMKAATEMFKAVSYTHLRAHE